MLNGGPSDDPRRYGLGDRLRQTLSTASELIQNPELMREVVNRSRGLSQGFSKSGGELLLKY